MKSKCAVLTLPLLLLTQFSYSQLLIPDSLFGTNSIANYTFPTGVELSKVIELPNNYILYGGYNYDISQNDFHIDMVKSDYCGAVDTTFGINGLVHYKFSQRNLAFDFSIQADGKILSCGIESTSNAGSGQIPYVSRFLINGEADTTFGILGSNSLRFDPVSSGKFFGVIEMPDGRVVCTGYSSGNINGGTNGIGAMRFFSNGTLDPSFSGDGIVRYDITTPNSLGNGFVSSSNDVIAAGAYYDGVSSNRFMVAVWDSNGVLNPAFSGDGIYQDVSLSISNEVYATRDSSANLTLAATASGSANTIHLLRLTGAGNPDTGFGTGGMVTITHPNIMECKGLQNLPGGKFLVSGQNNSGTGFCTMLNSDGSVDTTFGIQGILQVNVNGGISSHYLRGMVALPNGQLVFGGNGSFISARRLTDVSEVPHISQVFNYLQTTGNGTYQWHLNGIPVPGATNDTIHFTQNGDYTVLLTGDYGCTYLSDPYTVNNVGLTEVNSSGFSVYPNPIYDMLTFRTDKKEAGTVSLFSSVGKLLWTIELNIENRTYEINTASLAAGAYFLSYNTMSGVKMMRIIKL